jgi:hypothetical protein
MQQHQHPHSNSDSKSTHLRAGGSINTIIKKSFLNKTIQGPYPQQATNRCEATCY